MQPLTFCAPFPLPTTTTSTTTTPVVPRQPARLHTLASPPVVVCSRDRPGQGDGHQHSPPGVLSAVAAAVVTLFSFTPAAFGAPQHSDARRLNATRQPDAVTSVPVAMTHRHRETDYNIASSTADVSMRAVDSVHRPLAIITRTADDISAVKTSRMITGASDPSLSSFSSSSSFAEVSTALDISSTSPSSTSPALSSERSANASSSSSSSTSSNLQANATVLSDWSSSGTSGAKGAATTATRRGSTTAATPPSLMSLLRGSATSSSGGNSGGWSRMRPSTVELVGVGAVTSGSAVFLRQKQYWGRGRYQDDVDEDLESVLHNVCTVVCMQIPFCVSERASLLRNLENLVQTSSCRDAASLAAACRNAACIIEEEAGVGVFEDSRRFAPHVDVFLAQSFREAERRFSSHVKTEGAHIDKLMQYYQNKKKKLASGQVNEQDFEQGDYGVVTLVVATREGVDLRCYDDSLEDTVSCTNLRKLRRALHAVAQLKDGEAAGLEVLWVPVDETDGGMGLKQMAESYPALRLY